MGLLATVLIALVAGGVWAVTLRRLRRRRRLIAAPAPATRALRAYTAGRWDRVISLAPAALALPAITDGAEGDHDRAWRRAVELALGHALVQRDRPEEAIDHLQRGLAGPAGPGNIGAEARMRHMLAYALAATDRTAEARAEYHRILEEPSLDPDIRSRVTAALEALEA